MVRRAQLLAGSGSGFDSSAVAHPSVIADGASYALYYGASDGSGTRSIGRVTSASVAGPYIARTQVLTAGATGSFDAGGVKDPVVVKAGATDYRMLYTGIEPLGGGETVERIGYATSSDGTSWTKRGVVLSPSRKPFGPDEAGVTPSGMLVDGSVLHVFAEGTDRSGRGRALALTTAYPTPVSPAAAVPNGDATYQLGDSTTSVRDFRSITRTSSGTGVALWLSFLQPYSSSGSEFWSDWFPVTESASTETLNFLLTVRGVRWQARLNDAAGLPELDRVEIQHAPVNFAAAGEATTTPIAPPEGQGTTAWGTLTAATTTLGSGGASGTVTVLDGVSGAQLLSGALNTGGQSVIDLSSLSATEHPTLRARIQLLGGGGATPLVQSLKILFNAAAKPPAPPPPPPPPVYTLTASPQRIVFGQQVTLSGVVTASGLPLVGGAVSLIAQPAGLIAAAAGTTTSDAAGAYRVLVSPDRQTIYSVASATGTAPVVVQVAPKITLTARRTRTRGTFSGRIAPAWPKRPVTIQLKRGSRWVTYAKLTTTATSTFSVRKKGLKPKAKYRFRAVTAATAEHLPGSSPEALVDAMKVALKVAAKGRKVTFSGSVRPVHRRLAVTIEELVGTRWVKLAGTKLTSRSTFRVTKQLKPGVHVLRARSAEDRDHFGGISAQKKLTLR